MAAYKQLNFEQIAAAIGVEVGQIAKHANQLEAAALWYRLDRRRPARTAPFQLPRSWTGSLRALADSSRAWASIILVLHMTVLATPRFSVPSFWQASPARILS
jgi:hypothetical protein